MVSLLWFAFFFYNVVKCVWGRAEWGNAPTRVRRLQLSTSDTTKLSYQPAFFSGRVLSGSASISTTRVWYALLIFGKHM